MTHPKNSKTPRNGKKLFVAVYIVPVILLGCAIGVFFYDVPAPDDSDMRAKPKTIARSDNAVPLLNRTRKMLKTKLKDFPEIQARLDVVERAKWSLQDEANHEPEISDIILEKNRDAIALFWEATTKPCIQFGQRWPELPDFDKELCPPEANTYAITHALGFMWSRMRREGRGGQALDESCRLLDFSCRIACAENAALIDLFVALAVNTAALRNIEASIADANDSALCIQTANRLGTIEIPDSALATSLKGEYVFMDDLLNNPLLHEKRRELLSKGTRALLPYFHKPNQTRILILDMYRKIINGIADGKVLKYTDPLIFPASNRRNYDLFYIRFYALFKPNASGEELHRHRAVAYSFAYDTMQARRAKTRQLACAFAIRAYWLENQRLPPTLESLVPKYIAVVSEDPFANKPMPYNPKKRLLYCTEKRRGIDDGGAYALEKFAEPFGSRPFVLLDWATDISAETLPRNDRK